MQIINDIQFTATGLTEKIDKVNEAIEYLHRAQRLLLEASQISVDVLLVDSRRDRPRDKILCKDCVYFHESQCWHEHWEIEGYCPSVEQNDYCSYGEPRVD